MLELLKAKIGKKVGKKDVLYGVVEWGDVAKTSAMGIPSLKKIVLYRNNTPVSIEPFNEAKLMQYNREIKIFDDTAGERVPQDAITLPYSSEIAVALMRTQNVLRG
ncbi:MAG: hypothetical protein ACOC80_17025 [Petrotogales bacterium]